MGLLKLVGGLLTISSTTVIGYYYGNRFSNRLTSLIYLEQCFKILETEIVYGAIPLPEALINVYNKGNKRVAFIFKEIRSELMINRKAGIYDVFRSVIPILKGKLHLYQEDVEIFLSLGRVLGSSDRKDQGKNFIFIFNQIKILQQEAKMERDKNERIYKTLGMLTGITILIILF